MHRCILHISFLVCALEVGTRRLGFQQLDVIFFAEFHMNGGYHLSGDVKYLSVKVWLVAGLATEGSCT